MANLNSNMVHLPLDVNVTLFHFCTRVESSKMDDEEKLDDEEDELAPEKKRTKHATDA